jgi:uncharacterized protein YaiI (UPF0178 family)
MGSRPTSSATAACGRRRARWSSWSSSLADHIGTGDIAITADTPLAARCIAEGAKVLRFNGEPFDEQSIGAALATRDLMTHLRETGEITGGPRPFSKQDRSRFLNALETTVQAVKRETA